MRDDQRNQEIELEGYPQSDIFGYPNFLELYKCLYEKGNSSGVIIVNDEWDNMLEEMIEEFDIEEDVIFDGFSYLEHRGYIEVGINEDNFVADIIIYHDSEIVEPKSDNKESDEEPEIEVEPQPEPEQLTLFDME